METDLRKHTAPDHHDQHHGTNAPGTQPNDAHSRISENTLEKDKNVHHQETNEPKERKSKMNKKIALTLNSAALSALIIFSLSSGTRLQAAELKAKVPGITRNQSIVLKADILKLNGGVLDNLGLLNLRGDALKFNEFQSDNVKIGVLKLIDAGLINDKVPDERLGDQGNVLKY
jgi:hypothetical protein